MLYMLYRLDFVQMFPTLKLTRVEDLMPPAENIFCYGWT